MTQKRPLLDLVIRWSEAPALDARTEPCGKMQMRVDGGWELFFTITGSKGQKVGIKVPLASGETPETVQLGPQKSLRWGCYQLGPTVWKLTPVLDTGFLLAYLTLVDVPEPAPWLPVPHAGLLQ